MQLSRWGLVLFGVAAGTGAICVFARSIPVRADGVPRLEASMTNEEVSRAVAHALAARFAEKGIAVEGAGGSVRVGDHALTIRASIDFVRKMGDKSAVGLDVSCSADGALGVALGSGSLGVDDTPEAALRTAVGEWVLQFGTAIVAALHRLPEKGLLLPAVRVGGFVFYPGPTGYRGESPPGSKTAFHEELVRRLQPVLESTQMAKSTGLHGINLTLDVRDGVVESGECRLDGIVSPAVCEIAKQMPWPRSARYMLKQYYVFQRTSESQ